MTVRVAMLVLVLAGCTRSFARDAATPCGQVDPASWDGDVRYAVLSLASAGDRDASRWMDALVDRIDAPEVALQRLSCTAVDHRDARRIGAEMGADLVVWGAYDDDADVTFTPARSLTPWRYDDVETVVAQEVLSDLPFHDVASAAALDGVPDALTAYVQQRYGDAYGALVDADARGTSAGSRLLGIAGVRATLTEGDLLHGRRFGSAEERARFVGQVESASRDALELALSYCPDDACRVQAHSAIAWALGRGHAYDEAEGRYRIALQFAEGLPDPDPRWRVELHVRAASALRAALRRAEDGDPDAAAWDAAIAAHLDAAEALLGDEPDPSMAAHVHHQLAERLRWDDPARRARFATAYSYARETDAWRWRWLLATEAQTAAERERLSAAIAAQWTPGSHWHGLASGYPSVASPTLLRADFSAEAPRLDLQDAGPAGRAWTSLEAQLLREVVGQQPTPEAKLEVLREGIAVLLSDGDGVALRVALETLQLPVPDDAWLAAARDAIELAFEDARHGLVEGVLDHLSSRCWHDDEACVALRLDAAARLPNGGCRERDALLSRGYAAAMPVQDVLEQVRGLEDDVSGAEVLVAGVAAGASLDRFHEAAGRCDAPSVQLNQAIATAAFDVLRAATLRAEEAEVWAARLAGMDGTRSWAQPSVRTAVGVLRRAEATVGDLESWLPGTARFAWHHAQLQYALGNRRQAIDTLLALHRQGPEALDHMPADYEALATLSEWLRAAGRDREARTVIAQLGQLLALDAMDHLTLLKVQEVEAWNDLPVPTRLGNRVARAREQEVGFDRFVSYLSVLRREAFGDDSSRAHALTYLGGLMRRGRQVDLHLGFSSADWCWWALVAIESSDVPPQIRMDAVYELGPSTRGTAAALQDLAAEATAAGDRLVAIDALARVLSLVYELDEPSWRVHARVALAEALAAERDMVEAIRHLEAARSLADGMGFADWGADIDRRLRALRDT